MKYLFGPVLSRRMGISLGIDLLPFKTCSFDCIYCECGCTTTLTTDRDEFFPTNDIIDELDAYLAIQPQLDYITFAGSGEPTLHTGIGRIISFLKEKYSQYKVAVLTNGTLLGNELVQKELLPADLVVPSLDGATEASFTAICRPAVGVTFEKTIEGISSFRAVYHGRLMLEFFVVPGINDMPEEIAALKIAAFKIKPDEIQLNTLSRPGCEKNIEVPTESRLAEIADQLKPFTIQYALSRSSDGATGPEVSEPVDRIISVLARRAASLDDIVLSTGLEKRDAAKLIMKLENEDVLEKSGDKYYTLKKK
jgi:wyosine [tRNA(Phe)-imidazoG37] synthetase (radical SAM superfamily)